MCWLELGIKNGSSFKTRSEQEGSVIQRPAVYRVMESGTKRSGPLSRARDGFISTNQWSTTPAVHDRAKRRAAPSLSGTPSSCWMKTSRERIVPLGRSTAACTPFGPAAPLVQGSWVGPGWPSPSHLGMVPAVCPSGVSPLRPSAPSSRLAGYMQHSGASAVFFAEKASFRKLPLGSHSTEHLVKGQIMVRRGRSLATGKKPGPAKETPGKQRASHFILQGPWRTLVGKRGG